MRVTPRKIAFAGCTTLATWAFLSGHLGLPGHENTASQRCLHLEENDANGSQDMLIRSAYQHLQKDELLLKRLSNMPGMGTPNTALEAIPSIR